MSAVVVDMYRGHANDMEIDDGESKAIHASISIDDVTSFLAAQRRLDVKRTASEPPKEKRTSRTYQFSDRDIRRYQQARKEGRLRFPDLFMYHIQRPTEDIQKEARLARKIQEQQEAELIAAQITAAAASNAVLEVVSEDQPPVRIVISGNAGIVALEQHSAHHCDESMALKSEVSEQAGKLLSLAPGAVRGVSGVSITQTHEEIMSKEKTTKRRFKMGKLVMEGKLGKKVIPMVIVAAAGFAGVLIVTSSVGIGFAVAIPCAAITYGSIKLYEHCKKKKMLKSSKQSKKNSGIAAESAPLASRIELADH